MLLLLQLHHDELSENLWIFWNIPAWILFQQNYLTTLPSSWLMALKLCRINQGGLTVSLWALMFNRNSQRLRELYIISWKGETILEGIQQQLNIPLRWRTVAVSHSWRLFSYRDVIGMQKDSPNQHCNARFWFLTSRFWKSKTRPRFWQKWLFKNAFLFLTIFFIPFGGRK